MKDVRSSSKYRKNALKSDIILALIAILAMLQTPQKTYGIGTSSASFEVDQVVKEFMDQQKRDEALKWLISKIVVSKGEERAVFIRRAHVVGCVFITNKTFQNYQEGHTYLLNKKYRLAKEKFEKTLAEEPDNIEILTRLGQSEFLDGDFDNAQEHFSLANKLNPYEPQVKLWLGKVMTLKRNDKGVPELRAAYSELKNSEQAVVWLAEALSLFGQPNSAIRLLETDVKQWPFHIWSLFTLAKIQFEVGSQESRTLWAARKGLQLALSRVDQYGQSEGELNNLELDLRKPDKELKFEVQKLLNQVQAKLADIAPPTSKKRSL